MTSKKPAAKWAAEKAHWAKARWAAAENVAEAAAWEAKRKTMVAVVTADAAAVAKAEWAAAAAEAKKTAEAKEAEEPEKAEAWAAEVAAWTHLAKAVAAAKENLDDHDDEN